MNPESPGGVLGIDYGEARVGVARSDELGWMAHPLETIEVASVDPVERIAELVSQHRAGTIVLGIPLRMDGTEGPAVAKVREFRQKLESALGEGVEVVEVDERLSTVAAQRGLHDSGRDTRRSRGVIDQAAAAVILQAYLDRQQGALPLPEEWEEEDD